MNSEAAFLRAIQERPSDASLRLVFADWLEERGDPRGEVLRLLSVLTHAVEVPDRAKLEKRLRTLLASGVQPVGPFFTNSIGMRFALIWPGTFLMGSPESEKGRNVSVMSSCRSLRPTDDEGQHAVTLTKGFYLAVHPVAQASWRKVMKNNPSHFKGDSLPVEMVSWDDCQQFVRKVSKLERRSYRLPTEAEWEYACRAGTTTPYSFGNTITKRHATFRPPHLTGAKTSPVGTFPYNAWGLFDMHGNVGMVF
jgi:uncharacterized protein (TIGR02996 family)